MIFSKYSLDFREFFTVYLLLVTICSGETASDSEFSGYKIGSNTSSDVYDSSDFRSQLFSSATPYFLPQSKTDALFTIPERNPAVRFDSRSYFWTRQDAFFDLPIDAFICEYHLGHKDGDLHRIKFSNGTRATHLFFGCEKDSEKCCGMYCCHSDSSLGAAALFLFIFVFCPVIGCLFCVTTACCECFDIQCLCCTTETRRLCCGCSDNGCAGPLAASCANTCSDTCAHLWVELGSDCVSASCDCNC